MSPRPPGTSASASPATPASGAPAGGAEADRDARGRPKPRTTADGRRQLLLHLPPDLIRRLKHAAVDQDRSASALAEEALEALLDRLEAREP